jgi:hypothetical protein
VGGDGSGWRWFGAGRGSGGRGWRHGALRSVVPNFVLHMQKPRPCGSRLGKIEDSEVVRCFQRCMRGLRQPLDSANSRG